MATGALPITLSPIERSFETPITRFGTRGLQLNKALDALDVNELARMSNLTHRQGGFLTPRPGQTELATTAGTLVHTIGRLNDPASGGFTRLSGIDTELYFGQSGPLTQIDTGYSGRPLWMVQYRPPLSGESWMFIGDEQRMRKVRASDGLDLPIGLPAPGAAPGAVVNPAENTVVAAFDGGDGSQAAAWTGTPGFGFLAEPGIDNTTIAAGPVTVVDAFGLSGNAVAFRGNPGATGSPFTPTGYWFMAGLARALNLTFVGATAAEDDDLMHLYMNWSHVQFITEVRIYLVCSTTFSATVLPGGADAAGINADFYVKSFSPNDFGKAYAARESISESAETARTHTIRDDSLERKRIRDERESWRDRRAERDPARSKAPQGPPSNDSWTEFGVLGVPLRRGDFKRSGITAGRDWATITGIVVYIACGPKSFEVEVRLDDLRLTGGSDPDTSEPGAIQYDWRYTHYDPRTGAEGNPSPIMAEADFKDALRQSITLTPAAHGDSAIRQRVYRRGGSLTADWFFAGENASDGGTFADTFSDDELSTEATLELDHDQPVSTTDEGGNTILAQPTRAIFGPVQDLLFLCGDPNRPGDVYHCIPGEPDHWPPNNHVEVCPPGEELMAGCVYSNQPFVFSRERLYALYPNLPGEGSVSAAPTTCKKGLAGYWALAVGRLGMYFVNPGGVYRTDGGEPEWLSEDLDPLFHGTSVNGYEAIDMTDREALRLEVHDDDLYFLYEGTPSGLRQILVYSIPFRFWRHYVMLREIACVNGEEEAGALTLVMGGRTTGDLYTHTGFSDDGVAIPWRLTTGARDYDRPREDKLFGDVIVDADRQGVVITVQTLFNHETITNVAQALEDGTGRQRFVLDPFGAEPERARTLSIDMQASSATAAPILYQAGASVIPEPDVTLTRVTQWDDLGHASEKYLTGIVMEADTFDEDKIVHIEIDFNGARTIVATVTVHCNGRHKRFFSFDGPEPFDVFTNIRGPGAWKANLVRIRPEDECIPWILYKLDWIANKEPPRIAKWDSDHENHSDTYYTGLDLECDTFGADKKIEVWIDQSITPNPLTGDPFFLVNTNHRRYVHLTFGPGRGHIYRYRAIDENVGLLYSHKWWLDPEPAEQSNWNQNFVTPNHTDKWFKAVTLQADTFGAGKIVTIELDGVVIDTFPVVALDRRVVHHAFPEQKLGRVLRLISYDGLPGRLYNWQPIYDDDPFSLSRWETQEQDFGFPGFKTLLYAYVTVRTLEPVIMRTILVRQHGALASHLELPPFEIPDTLGVKQTVFVPFPAAKGVLVKFLFESTSLLVPFTLYREESVVVFQAWGSEQLQRIKPFGSDDRDGIRQVLDQLTTGRITTGVEATQARQQA